MFIAMKNAFFKMAIVAFAACIAMVSCSKEPIGVEEESEFYTVQLGWAGEILDVSYEPLTRAANDDLYGIQVYSAPNNDAATTTWTKFAYGVFEGADNITINLLKGYKYKFVATMVVDGKNKVLKDGEGYYRPFTLDSNASKELNKFNFSSQYGLSGLGNGTTFLKNPSHIYSRPNVERFYGELVDYVPGSNGNKAKIHMKRTSFKAKFIAKGKLAKSGTLNIMMTDAPEMNLALSNSNNQISDMFTFSDVDAAWADNQYSETVDVTLTWTRTDGTVVPLNTHKVSFKRNATTVVQVTIDNDANKGELGFEIDDTDVTEGDDENPDVEITDGESVKTNVTTNH